MCSDPRTKAWWPAEILCFYNNLGSKTLEAWKGRKIFPKPKSCAVHISVESREEDHPRSPLWRLDRPPSSNRKVYEAVLTACAASAAVITITKASKHSPRKEDSRARGPIQNIGACAVVENCPLSGYYDMYISRLLVVQRARLDSDEMRRRTSFRHARLGSPKPRQL